MPKRIYVGNLPFTATEPEIRTLFEEFGTVREVNMVTDRETGRFRGFGFVEMDDKEADSAISKMDGVEFNGRALRVNEARERPGGRHL